MWDIFVVYSRSAVGRICGRHIHSETYASNVKCIHTSAPGHICN